MKGRRIRGNRVSSPMSDLGSDDSTDFLERRDSSSPDSYTRESVSIEWTDEKHSLYLKSMETSFVNQLYDSLDLLGCGSQNEKLSDLSSSWKDNGKSRPSSGQFKVLRGGCWQRINFQRAELQANKADNSQVLLANPWIQHFRPPCRHQVEASLVVPDNPAFKTQAVHSRGKKAISCGGDTHAKKTLVTHSHVCNQDSTENEDNTEMSDQNFVDEHIEGEKVSGTKRMRTLVVDPSSTDQVVPFGQCPGTEDVGKKPVSS
ncbi:hypothetical protein RJ641_032187 [Dillenia turbinata]|uniref:Uncharacterized protein n=1 Tax=Dillenia turbinata TaxID=194707 RepID=A0AAN8VRG0_9MAGN